MLSDGVSVGINGKGTRHGGSEGRRWGGDGPVGADGARPILGKYSGGIGTPSATSFGASGKMGQRKGAAMGGTDGVGGKGPGHRAAAEGGSKQLSKANGGKPAASEGREPTGKPMGAWARPLRVVDEEGYTLVQPRRAWRPEGTTDGSNDAVVQPGDTARAAVARPRWADEDSDDDMHVADDDEVEEQADEDDSGDGGPDPQRLRARFEALARATRDLERRARGGADDPAVHALRSARDEAERDWRQAKSPAPLPTRMGRAQSKLEKAGAALTRARRAVDEFDEWVEAHRATLVQRMDDADSWYRWRQQQLHALHEEAGEKAGTRAGGHSTAAGRDAVISERIASEWLPGVQALLEHLQGNPEVEERLACMAASMQSVDQELNAARAQAAEEFNIGGDDDWDQRLGDHEEHPHSADKGDSNARGDEPKGGAACWRPEGPGRWARKGNEQGKGQTGTTKPWDTHGPEGASGTGSNMAAAAAMPVEAAATTPSTGNKRGAEECTEDKSAMRQKTDADARGEADRKRAAEMLQRQQEAIAAQQASHEAGAGGFGSATAQALAAQQFIADACKAVARARKVGIVPKSNGKELVELAPMELQQWMADNLGDEAEWD